MKSNLTLLTALLLAPLAALHAAAPPASPDGFPPVSWERVPRYMHIRKDTAFSADEKGGWCLKTGGGITTRSGRIVHWAPYTGNLTKQTNRNHWKLSHQKWHD